MVENDSNVVLYVYDLNEEKFVRAGTVTKKFYVTDIQPKITFGSPDKEAGRDATIQKLYDLNGLQFVDIFEEFNEDVGIKSNDTVSITKFGDLLKQYTEKTGERNTFANLLSNGFNVDKEKIVNSSFFHHVVIAEPPSRVTMHKSGKGELFLCFYGNGSKGVEGKGDVYLNNVLYELKKNQGRLLPGLKIKPTKEIMQEIINESNIDKQLNLIIDMIHKAAGCVIDERYGLREYVNLNLQQIIDVLKYNITPVLSNLYLKFVAKIIGIVSLIGYQVNHGFNRLVLFELTREVEFISFNFDETVTVEQLFNIPGIKYKIDYNSTLGHQINFI